MTQMRWTVRDLDWIRMMRALGTVAFNVVAVVR